MAETSDISFINPKRQVDSLLTTGALPNTPAVKTRSIPAPTNQEISQFHRLIKPLGVRCAVLSVVPEYASEFQPKSLQLNMPDPLTDLFNEDHIEMDKESLANMASSVFPKITVTKEQVKLSPI